METEAEGRPIDKNFNVLNYFSSSTTIHCIRLCLAVLEMFSDVVHPLYRVLP